MLALPMVVLLGLFIEGVFDSKPIPDGYSLVFGASEQLAPGIRGFTTMRFSIREVFLGDFKIKNQAFEVGLIQVTGRGSSRGHTLTVWAGSVPDNPSGYFWIRRDGKGRLTAVTDQRELCDRLGSSHWYLPHIQGVDDQPSSYPVGRAEPLFTKDSIDNLMREYQMLAKLSGPRHRVARLAGLAESHPRALAHWAVMSIGEYHPVWALPVLRELSGRAGIDPVAMAAVDEVLTRLDQRSWVGSDKQALLLGRAATKVSKDAWDSIRVADRVTMAPTSVSIKVLEATYASWPKVSEALLGASGRLLDRLPSGTNTAEERKQLKAFLLALTTHPYHAIRIGAEKALKRFQGDPQK